MCHDAAAIRTEAAGEVAQVVCTSITHALFTHPQPCMAITTILKALNSRVVMPIQTRIRTDALDSDGVVLHVYTPADLFTQPRCSAWYDMTSPNGAHCSSQCPQFAACLPDLLFILAGKSDTSQASKHEMRGGDLWLSLDATASWCGPLKWTVGTEAVLAGDLGVGSKGAVGVATAHYAPSLHAPLAEPPRKQYIAPLEC